LFDYKVGGKDSASTLEYYGSSRLREEGRRGEAKFYGDRLVYGFKSLASIKIANRNTTTLRMASA